MSARIDTSHLERRACVYVRQSTAAQVFEHGESTERQYALAKRAVGLGWSQARVEVIDEDLGRSGATTEGRSGFARLVDGASPLTKIDPPALIESDPDLDHGS